MDGYTITSDNGENLVSAELTPVGLTVITIVVSSMACGHFGRQRVCEVSAFSAKVI